MCVQVNVAGRKGYGKLSATLLEAEKKKVEIDLVKEHYLTHEWEEPIEEMITNRGYHACKGYVTRSVGRRRCV